jgi:hypothetical protein
LGAEEMIDTKSQDFQATFCEFCAARMPAINSVRGKTQARLLILDANSVHGSLIR